MIRNKSFVMGGTVLGILMTLLVGCAAERAVRVSEGRTPSAPGRIQEPPEYRIQPGDELDIKFLYTPELNQTVVVRPDGKVSLHLLDEVQAAGLAPAEFDAAITGSYATKVKEPTITVAVKTFATRKVYVGGQVGKPGLVDLLPGMTALQAVINAGGFLDSAKPEAALILRTGAPDGTIRANLGQATNGEAAGGDMQLQPLDVVYVPKTWIAAANLFVNQYVRGLLLFNGWGFSLNPFATSRD